MNTTPKAVTDAGNAPREYQVTRLEMGGDLVISGDESLTDAQRHVLNYMGERNLGVLFSDERQDWIWPSQIRNDPNLAVSLILEKTEIGHNFNLKPYRFA